MSTALIPAGLPEVSLQHLKPQPDELLSVARHVAQSGIQADAQATAVLRLLGIIDQLTKAVEDAFAPSVKAAHETHKAILAARDTHANVLEEAEKLLRTALNKWAANKAAVGERVAGVQTVNKVKFTVEDLSQVPREYLVLDEKKVKAVIKEHGLDTDIPGIRVYADVSVRKARGTATVVDVLEAT